MKSTRSILFILFFLSLSLISTQHSKAQPNNLLAIPIPDSDSDYDTDNYGLTAFFDLRERESFVQITNTQGSAINLHVQIYDVGNLCNENDFFDAYTVNDTHVYNLRSILTNDGNPSGFVLPDNAFGIVVISPVDTGLNFLAQNIIGNFRILDNSGYEYRTNMTGWNDASPLLNLVDLSANLTFNFSQDAGVVFSDVVGVYVHDPENGVGEYNAANVTRTFVVMDVDIFDLNEVPLSCRDVIFACVEPNGLLVDEILSYNGGDGGTLEGTNGANVASFEYGINEAIPHSRDGEVLCPGNNITNGFVSLTVQGIAYPYPDAPGGYALLNVFVGLNNGNGRGSMDSVWWPNDFLNLQQE